MTKRIICLLLAALAAASLYVPALAQDAPPETGGDIFAAGTEKTALSAPKLTGASNTAAGVKVTWQAVKGAKYYRVFYKTGSDGWKRAGDTAKTGYTVKGLKSGTKYTFTVRCLSTGKKSYASGYDKKGKSVVYVAAPTVKASVAANGIKLSWNKVAGASKYRVYYRVNGGGWKAIGHTEKTGYTWKKAVFGNTYQFTVRCTDANKKLLGGYKAGASLRYLPAPTLSGAENVAEGVEVTWGAVKGAASYRVYYKTGSGGWKRAGDTAKTGYTVTGLKSGTKYAFTVRCLSDDGKSCASTYDAVGRSATWLAVPKVKAVNTANGIKVTWNKIAGAEKYRVYFKAKGSGGWNLILTTKAASYVWDEAVLDMSYAFTVRASGSGSLSTYKGSGYLKYTGHAASPTDT